MEINVGDIKMDSEVFKEIRETFEVWTAHCKCKLICRCTKLGLWGKDMKTLEQVILHCHSHHSTPDIQSDEAKRMLLSRLT